MRAFLLEHPWGRDFGLVPSHFDFAKYHSRLKRRSNP